MSEEKSKTFNKVTIGFVIQKFSRDEDDIARCKEQTFIAGDQVDFETPDEKPLCSNEVEPYEYFPFNMEQPDSSKK